MSNKNDNLLNGINPSINVFEKFFLQQTNKNNKYFSNNPSINTTISKISSSIQTNILII